MSNESQASPIKVALAFAAIYLIWGSTYLAILIAIESIPPFMMIAVRFIVAGLLLFLGCLVSKYPLPTTSIVIKNSFAGILMLGGGTGAVTWVEQYISSGLTAIIIASAPILFVLLDKRKWHYHLSNKRIILGLLIGLAGVILLVADRSTFNLQDHPMQVISIIVLICGEVLWVSGSLYSKYRAPEGSAPMNASIQMMAAGVALSLASMIAGEQHLLNLHTIHLESILALIYQIFFGSLIAYLSYVWLLTVRTPSLVGTYALVNPGVAVFLGWLIVDEKVVMRQIIALIVILSGVVLVTLIGRKQNSKS